LPLVVAVSEVLLVVAAGGAARRAQPLRKATQEAVEAIKNRANPDIVVGERSRAWERRIVPMPGSGGGRGVARAWVGSGSRTG